MAQSGSSICAGTVRLLDMGYGLNDLHQEKVTL